MPTITKDLIIFGPEDWTAGLNAQYGSTALVTGRMVANASNYYPFRPDGVAAPGYSFTGVTNQSAVTGKVVAGINKTGSLSKAILLDNAGLIHELTFSTNTVTNGGTFPYTISHAHTNEVGEDMVAYSIGSTRYTFYSFRDDTDWDIGRYDNSTTFDDDYMSTVAASPLASPYTTGGKDAPHPMIVGPDDILYIGDRNFIHSFDGQTGANGTFAAATYTLPQGFTTTSLATRDEFLVVFAYRSDQTDSDGSVKAEAAAFFYDLISGAVDPVKIVPLDDNYVNGGFKWRGTVGCFTSGRPTEAWAGSSSSKKTDLRILNGWEFEAVASFDGTSPVHNGVDVVSDEIMWNAGGKVFLFAAKDSSKGYKLHQIAQASSGSSSGFLRTMTDTKQYLSAGTGTSGGLMYSAPTAYASTASMSTVYVRPFAHPLWQSKLKSVTVNLHTLGAADQTLTVNVNYLGGPTGQQTVLSSFYSTGDYNIHRSVDTSDAPFSRFNRIGLELAWTATSGTPPLVDSIVLEYGPINQ